MSVTNRGQSDSREFFSHLRAGVSGLDNLVRVLAIGVLGLLAVTWKLWTPQTDFPQVPLTQLASHCPGWVDWFCLGSLIAASAMLVIDGRRRLASRWAFAVMASAWALFFLLNQHRLQPWAWQFFLLSLVLALADDIVCVQCWSWLAISIYFWSAVSKLDFTFVHDQGPALIEALKSVVGLRPGLSRWTNGVNVWGAIVLAVGEFAVAILLAVRQTRRFGVWLALLMHAMLLLALGPLGLRHSAGVLGWNLFFAAQTWLLFFPKRNEGTPAAMSSTIANRPKSQVRLGNGIAVTLTVIAMIMPALESVGYCDTWLAWAVYSARSGNSEVLCESLEGPKTLNVEFDDVVRVINGQSEVFSRARIAAWSLRELGVPVYPQYRFYVAVGRYLHGEVQPQRVLVTNQKHNRITGTASELQIVDLPSHANGHPTDPFFWNTQPRWRHRD